jgi:hypothetical protein
VIYSNTEPKIANLPGPAFNLPGRFFALKTYQKPSARQGLRGTNLKNLSGPEFPLNKLKVLERPEERLYAFAWRAALVTATNSSQPIV